MKNKSDNRLATDRPGRIFADSKPRRHPLFGRLKGTFTIDADWDVTNPAMPEWAQLIDEKYGSQKPKQKR
jgi:hypothetical protein